jgi:hypothetical protein
MPWLSRPDRPGPAPVAAGSPARAHRGGRRRRSWRVPHGQLDGDLAAERVAQHHPGRQSGRLQPVNQMVGMLGDVQHPARIAAEPKAGQVDHVDRVMASGGRRTCEKAADHAGEPPWLLPVEQVPGSAEQLHAGIGEQAGQHGGVARVHDLIGRALHDQGGLGDAACRSLWIGVLVGREAEAARPRARWRGAGPRPAVEPELPCLLAEGGDQLVLAHRRAALDVQLPSPLTQLLDAALLIGAPVRRAVLRGRLALGRS